MEISIEMYLLGISILFFLSILAGKAGNTFGVPALLLFLSIGMISGTDGLGIQFDNTYAAQFIGTIALCIILFSGGMDTKYEDITKVMKEGILLSTLGVMLTALLTAVLSWWAIGELLPSIGLGFVSYLLLSATLSSTDSASVFSILRGKRLNFKNNLRPMLELESGSNDPMAYILVITITEITLNHHAPSYIDAGLNVIIQLLIGGGAGYTLGRLAIYTINHIRIDNDSLYPILVFTFCFFIFALTYFLQGNGYLAVYIGGLVIGNNKIIHKRSSMKFFDGLAWLSQLLMFLTLGLLVNPRELIPVILPSIIISLIMIFIARPLSVHISLLPFRRLSYRDKALISWVGLRGAVPIIFAIIPLAQEAPDARLIFNIVFFCTLISLLMQGTTIPLVARLLHLTETPTNVSKLENFDLDFSDDIKSVTSEIRITKHILTKGNKLIDLALPDQTLAVMVKRNNQYLIPTGKTELMENDILLIITDNQQALIETYSNIGLDITKKR